MTSKIPTTVHLVLILVLLSIQTLIVSAWNTSCGKTPGYDCKSPMNIRQFRAATECDAKTFGDRQADPQLNGFMMLIINMDHGKICAGTLLRPQWVLTAAYCLSKTCPGSKIQAIPHVINDVDSDLAELNYIEGTPYLHPNYYYDKQNNIAIHDIGLLKLSKPIYDCLYVHISTKDVGSCDSCYILGFAINEVNYNTKFNELEINFNNRILFEEDQELMDKYNCRYILGEQFYDQFAYVAREGQPPCPVRSSNYGDVGGPLMCNGFQVGIISPKPFKMRRCSETFVMWTRLSSYSNWIISIIENRCYEPVRLPRFYNANHPYSYRYSRRLERDCR